MIEIEQRIPGSTQAKEGTQMARLVALLLDAPGPAEGHSAAA